MKSTISCHQVESGCDVFGYLQMKTGKNQVRSYHACILTCSKRILRMGLGPSLTNFHFDLCLPSMANCSIEMHCVNPNVILLLMQLVYCVDEH
jgi:hypothetical protein